MRKTPRQNTVTRADTETDCESIVTEKANSEGLERV